MYNMYIINNIYILKYCVLLYIKFSNNIIDRLFSIYNNKINVNYLNMSNKYYKNVKRRHTENSKSQAITFKNFHNSSPNFSILLLIIFTINSKPIVTHVIRGTSIISSFSFSLSFSLSFSHSFSLSLSPMSGWRTFSTLGCPPFFSLFLPFSLPLYLYFPLSYSLTYSFTTTNSQIPRISQAASILSVFPSVFYPLLVVALFLTTIQFQ